MQPSSPSPAPAAPATPAAPTIAPAVPAAPAAPVPPAPSLLQSPSGAVVALPDGPIPLEGLPRTAREVEGLRARREILRDQLERATNRREGLAAELNRSPAPEARAGLQQRLSVLDERILQIERDQALTERLLSSAPPSVLAQTEMPVQPRGMVDDDEAAAVAFGTFGFGIVLTLLLGRLRRRLVGRRGARTTTGEALTEAERYERLSQAVDAIALEVERIGEGQRFVTQLLAERRDAPLLEAQRR